jgi:hypothetical protein
VQIVAAETLEETSKLWPEDDKRVRSVAAEGYDAAQRCLLGRPATIDEIH